MISIQSQVVYGHVGNGAAVFLAPPVKSRSNAMTFLIGLSVFPVTPADPAR